MSKINKGPARATIHTVDYETAVLNNLWGWRWVSMAAKVGPQTAAAHLLPPADEAAAQNFARTFTRSAPGAVIFARLAAEAVMSQALEAYQATLPLLSKVQAAHSVPLLLWREIEDLMCAAEHLGRAAAKMQRTLVLLPSEQGVAQ